jgi:hypothetical protein
MSSFNVKRRALVDPNTPSLSTADGSPLSSFGELNVAQLTPAAQGDFIYGINNLMFTTEAYSTGSVTTGSSNFAIINTNTSTTGSATVKLRRALKYRPGMGSLFRGTALFDTPKANNSQLIGVGNEDCGYYFGYQGTSFVILHVETAYREIRKLDVTTAVTTNEIVTVTLDGSSIAVPITGSASKSKTAYQIARQNYSNVGIGWRADVISGSVFFLSSRAASTFTGSYSVAGSTIVGSFSVVQSGSNGISTFIPQSSFNIDRIDGTGPSGFTINPQKGNVYQIGFQYLGFGNAFFAVENSETGRITPVHMIKNDNNRTTPVLLNPQVSGRLTSFNYGNNTNVAPKTLSMGTFTEGMVRRLDPRYARAATFSSIGTSDVALLAFKVNAVVESKPCYGEFDIVRIACANNSVMGANQATAIISIHRNIEIPGTVDFVPVDTANSIVSVADFSTAGTAVTTTNINPILTFGVAPSQGQTIDINTEELVYNVGDVILVTIRSSNNTVSGVLGINWFEQQ